MAVVQRAALAGGNGVRVGDPLTRSFLTSVNRLVTGLPAFYTCSPTPPRSTTLTSLLHEIARLTPPPPRPHTAGRPAPRHRHMIPLLLLIFAHALNIPPPLASRPSLIFAALLVTHAPDFRDYDDCAVSSQRSTCF